MDLFSPGTPILLQMNSGNDKTKYHCSIIGHERGKYFIVRIPSSYQRLIISGSNPLVPHIVSFTSRGYAFKFETQALA
ncbi:MAG: flagellar brake protein, partial [Candidatus Tectomicrobia bacterium]|nr:flagellar brake protein [Candidatus Tectomicrobia bacterium]